jgi:hypothetical protein
MRDAYKDIVFGLALFGISIFVLYWLIPVGIDSPGAVQTRALAPEFWPRIIIIALTGLSLLVALQGAVRIRQLRAGGPEDGPPSAGIDLVSKGKALVAILLLFAFEAVLDWGGLVVPSMLAIAVFTVLYGERRPHLIIPVAIGIPLVLYFFFLKVAQVPMPLGVFEDLLP